MRLAILHVFVYRILIAEMIRSLTKPDGPCPRHSPSPLSVVGSGHGGPHLPSYLKDLTHETAPFNRWEVSLEGCAPVDMKGGQRSKAEGHTRSPCTGT